MEFKPNYKTEDGLFEVMIDKDKLTSERPEVGVYPVSKDITTSQKITVYNTKTNAISQKSIYYNEHRSFYFKGYYRWNSYSYNINDLIPINE